MYELQEGNVYGPFEGRSSQFLNQVPSSKVWLHMIRFGFCELPLTCATSATEGGSCNYATQLSTQLKPCLVVVHYRPVDLQQWGLQTSQSGQLAEGEPPAEGYNPSNQRGKKGMRSLSSPHCCIS